MLIMLPAFATLLGYAALNLHRQIAFPPEYSKGQLTVARPVWHNVYSGFALHPTLAERESLRIDDISVIMAIGRHLKNSGREAVWKEMGGESPGLNGIKWAQYDLIVRDLLVSTCKDELLACAETFLYYKPVYFADTMLWFYRLTQTAKVASVFDSTYFGDAGTQQMIAASAELDKRGYSAAPWQNGFLWLCLLVVAGLALAGASSEWRIEMLSMFAMSFFSMAPSIAGYPAPLGMVDSAVSFTATLQIAAVVLLLLLLPRLAQRLSLFALGKST